MVDKVLVIKAEDRMRVSDLMDYAEKSTIGSLFLDLRTGYIVEIKEKSQVAPVPVTVTVTSAKAVTPSKKKRF